MCLSKKTNKTAEGEEIAPEGELFLDKNGEIIQNFSEYNTVKSCINSLILYAKAGNNNAIKEIIEIINTESKRLKIIRNKLIKVK